MKDQLGKWSEMINKEMCYTNTSKKNMKNANSYHFPMNQMEWTKYCNTHLLIQVVVSCHQIEPPSWFVGLDPKRLDWNPQIMSKVQDMPNSTPEKIGHLWQTRRARVGKRKRNLKPHKYYFWVKFSLPLPLPLSLLKVPNITWWRPAVHG